MSSGEPALFYSVRQAAGVLGVNPSTLYRPIRENSLPAVKIRSRYIMPRQVLEKPADEAVETDSLMDPSQVVQRHRTEKDLDHEMPGWRR